MTASFIVLTGASGAGKTTLARYFQNQRPACEVFLFDSIGVPPIEEMEAEYGTGEAWQRAMTLQWMERIRLVLSDRRPVLFEGQMRISFIREALAASGIANAHIILVDCDDSTRAARLRANRSQPELATPVMMNWARYLRDEALAFGTEVLDTGLLPFDDCIAHIARYLKSSLSDE